MVFRAENLGQQPLAAEMLHKPLFCSFFVKLEGYDVVGAQCARNAVRHNNGVTAEGAGRCRRVFVADYLAAAGVAYVRMQSARLALFPL